MSIFQSRHILRVLISIMFLAASAVSFGPRTVYATVAVGPYPTMGYSAMGPFAGSPYYQGQQNCGMVGQMPGYGQCGVDPMAVFYGLNWGGAQRLGSGSYLTPIGMSSLSNTYNHVQIMNRMSGAAY